MSTETLGHLVTLLQELPLLTAEQKEVLAQELAVSFPETKALAQELIKRNWLTPFQANFLLKGKAQDLVLGSYVLQQRLGHGGMGQVFLARHTLMDRAVALKVIQEKRLADPTVVQRFKKEIQATARLSHPNVVIAHDANRVQDTFFLVMEYVEGIDLARLLNQCAPLPVPNVCAYLRHAALGLQHMHEHGLVHRDIKPSNLILSARDAVVKVLDLGLARLQADLQTEVPVTPLTQPGLVMGTPDYMAPEQARDPRQADIRADIYSLGCTGYHLLTGQLPFPHPSLVEKLFRHRQVEPEPLENLRPELPEGLPAVIRRMMAKEPEDRFQEPREVAVSLAPFAESVATSPVGLVLANPAAVPEAMVATVSVPKQKPETEPEPLPSITPREKEPMAPVAQLVSDKGSREVVPCPPRRWSRRKPLIILGTGGLGLVFLWFLAPVFFPAKDRSGNPTSPGRTEEAPAGPKTEKPPEPVSWNPEVHGLLTRIMPRGLDGAAARGVYSQILNSLDRAEDNEWCLGSDLTRDNRAHLIQLKSSRLIHQVLTEAEAVKHGMDPKSIGSSATEKPHPLHGGQLVTLDSPQLRVHRTTTGSLRVTGQILCRSAGNEPLTDACLVLQRQFHRGDETLTFSRYQHFSFQEVPSGWLEVDLNLPGEQELSPEARGALADPKVSCFLVGFLQQPRPRLFQISGVCSLLLKDGKLYPNPDLQDGWNREARRLVERSLAQGVDSFPGLRLYSDLATGLDERENVSWTVGANHTSTQKALVVRLDHGKITTEELSPAQAKQRNIHSAAMLQTTSAIWPPLQPLVILSEPNLHLENPDGPLPRLVGKVRCEPLAERTWRYCLLVVHFKQQPVPGKEPTGGPGKTHNIPVRGTKPSSGWIEVDETLPPGRFLQSSFQVCLEAYLTWPRPLFYQVSNKLPFVP